MNENQNNFAENERNEQMKEPTPEVKDAAPEAPTPDVPNEAPTAPESAPEVTPEEKAADNKAVNKEPEATPEAQPQKEAEAPKESEEPKAEAEAPGASKPPKAEGKPQEGAEKAADGEKKSEDSKEKPAEGIANSKGKGKKPKKEKKPKKPKKLRKKHPVLRVFGAFFRFVLTLLLGMAIAYGSLVGIFYYAFSGLTIDTLQRFGIAKNADTYLTANGEVDLTSTSILELLADFNTIRADLSNHTLETLISRYGVVLPEETMAKLPTDLFAIPLNQLTSGDVGGVIANNLKFGYILSLLPSGMLSDKLQATLADRPLALLTNGEYGTLFSGVKLGYLMGVSFDENGNVTYADPAHPTLQEIMGTLDLGNILTAAGQNGDLLGVLATDIGNNDLRPLLTGIIDGALLDKMCEGVLIKDVILPDAETGRYRFDFEALAGGALMGDVLGYQFVNGTWYTQYTDNDDSSDDIAAPKLNAALAVISLGDVIGGRVKLEQTFDDVYFGDLQSGYARGDAITETDPESGEPVVVGFQWLKDGAPVGKMQQQLANIAANDLIGGKLDLNKTLGSLYVGDLQGFRRVEQTDPDSGEVISHKWMKTEGESEVEVSPVLSAVADISISAMLEGQLDIVATLGDLTFGEVQGYTLGVDGLWYREVQGQDGPVLEYVGAVQNSLANVPLCDVMNGEFSLTESFGGLYFGDMQSGYVRGDEITETDPESGEPVVVGYQWLKDGKPVSKMQQELANIAVTDLLNGQLNMSEVLGDLRVGDLQGYIYREILDDQTGEPVGHKWYKLEGENEVEVSPVLSALADISVSAMLDGNLDLAAALGDLKLGDVQGYTLG